MATQDIDRKLSVMIGERIRTARALAGISQTQLGDMLGVTFQQVQKYENGRNRISAPALIRLANALDHPIEFFTNTEPGKIDRLAGFSTRDIRLLRRMHDVPDDVAQAVGNLLRAVASGKT
jgi:transcriptional regulator with XRE-family HTH domain